MDFSLEELVVLLIAGSLLAVAIFSLLSRLMHQREEKQTLAGRNICRNCGHVFLATQSGRVSHCPVCGELNFHKKNGRLG